MGYPLPLRLPGVVAASSGAAAPPADAEIELFETTDLDLTAQTSPGNHFDLFATYTATHTDSTTVSCITYYSGSGSAHKLRFGGLKVGRWTITTTGSGDAGLDGQEFIVDVVPSTNADRIGFRTDIPGHENQWARLGPGGNAELFIPHDLMFGHPSETGGWPNLSADLDTFMGGHGFTGLHIMGVAAGWFSTTGSWNTAITTGMTQPAPLTFARMENMLAAVRDRGGHVHIWMWGDSQRSLSPIQLSGGKRGAEEQRVRRYIAGRLGPIACWSLGYGFDLNEWAIADDVSQLVSDFEGWCSYGHWYGGRYSEAGNPDPINNGVLTSGAQMWPGSYYGWEFWSNHAADYSTHAERSAFRDHPDLVDQPHFAEDRYRRRSDLNDKNFRDADGDDAAIPILWQHTMAGISAIWGKMESGEDGIVSASWGNIPKWKAHGDFWRGAINRFDLVRVPADSLGSGGTLVRRAANFTRFAAWEGPNAGELQVDYSGSPGNVDVYRADVDVSPLDLQLLFSDRAPQNEAFSMPHAGNWVLWIEPTASGVATGVQDTSGTSIADTAGTVIADTTGA